MGLTSEQVHWIGGGVFTGLAAALVLHETGAIGGRWPRYLLPVVFIVYGIENFIDPWIHGAAAPKDYAAETAQHLVQGAVMLAVGLVELLRARGRLEARAFGLVLPLGLLVFGGMFLFHAQHEAAAPAIVLTVQHRIFGATLAVAALAKAAAELGGEKAQAFRVAWLLPLLVFGLEMLLYTEGGAGMAGHGAAHGGH